MYSIQYTVPIRDTDLQYTIHYQYQNIDHSTVLTQQGTLLEQYTSAYTVLCLLSYLIKVLKYGYHSPLCIYFLSSKLHFVLFSQCNG